MCHGQIVNEALRFARKQNECADCGRPIKPRRRYVFATSRAEYDGLLSNSAVCVSCATTANRSWDRGNNFCMVADGADAKRDDAKRDGWRTFLADARKMLGGLKARADRRAAMKARFQETGETWSK